jgi:hypothetical protein
VSNKNVFRKSLPIGPGNVPSTSGSPHRREKSSPINFDISNNKEIYVECNENGKEYDVPDNNLGMSYII